MNIPSFEDLKRYIENLDTSSPDSYKKALIPLMALEGEQREQLAELVAEMFGVDVNDVLSEVEAKNRPLHEIIEEKINSINETPTPDQIEEICQRIASLHNEIFRQHLIGLLANKAKPLLTKADIKRRVNEIREEFLSLAESSTPTTNNAPKKPTLIQVKEKVPDAPIPEGLVFPPKYMINEYGEIVFEGDKFIEYVCPVPLFISRRIRDLEEETTRVELLYRIKGEWYRLTVPKSIIADSRKIIQLADCDVPVSSSNSRLIVRYLQEFEVYNLDVLPTAESVRSLGWHEWRGKKVFVWGNQVISADGEEIPLLVEADGVGEKQFLDAFQQGGTWEGWLDEVMKPAMKYPSLRMGIYAALASPLLAHCAAQGFAFHYTGRSTMGKSTAAQIALSVAGFPGGTGLPERPGVYRPWNMTEVGGERIFAFLKNLPAYLDDSHLVKKDEVVSRMIYSLANGQGRVRGAIRGMQRVASWRLVLISTGETTLSETSKMAGLQVRSVDWSIAPFEGAASDEDLDQVARDFKVAISTHYGHALPRMVQVLLQNGVETLAQQHQQVVHRIADKVRGRIGKNELVDRLAGCFGMIALAGSIFHSQVIPASHELSAVTPDEIEDFVAEYFAQLILKEQPEHTHVSAYRAVMSWAASNKHSFYGFDKERDKIGPPHGWYGVWNVQVTGMSGRFIAITPNVLRDFLTESGYPYESVLRTWRDVGLLIPDPKGKLQRVVHYGDTKARAVVLRFQDIDDPDTEVVSSDTEEPEVSLSDLF